MRSTSSDAPGTALIEHWNRWWHVCRQRAAQARRNHWWRQTLRENARLWRRCSDERTDPLPGTRLPAWARDLLIPSSPGHEPSTASLLHGGLIGLWRKHREEFQMIGVGGAQEFMDTLEWARDRDQGPVWDVNPLKGDLAESTVLRWAQDVAERHQASLFSAPLDWFVPNPNPYLRAMRQAFPGQTEYRLPDPAHEAWHQGRLRVLDGIDESDTPLKAMALSNDEWPVVVVRWNPIALAVMTGHWDRVHAWSQRAPQAARDAQHLLTVMGKVPSPDQPQERVGWERWVLDDLIHAPNPSVAQARARL